MATSRVPSHKVDSVGCADCGAPIQGKQLCSKCELLRQRFPQRDINWKAAGFIVGLSLACVYFLVAVGHRKGSIEIEARGWDWPLQIVGLAPKTTETERSPIEQNLTGVWNSVLVDQTTLGTATSELELRPDGTYDETILVDGSQGRVSFYSRGKWRVVRDHLEFFQVESNTGSRDSSERLVAWSGDHFQLSADGETVDYWRIPDQGSSRRSVGEAPDAYLRPLGSEPEWGTSPGLGAPATP